MNRFRIRWTQFCDPSTNKCTDEMADQNFIWRKPVHFFVLCAITMAFIVLVSIRPFNLSPPSLRSERNQCLQHTKEHHHVVFIKVHKAGSTTLFNIMARFALSRQLDVILNTREEHVNEYGSIVPRHQILPPSRDDKKYDMLFNHIIFNKTELMKYFPNDTMYLGIVRNPFDQFVSAFRYYGQVWNNAVVKAVLKDDPFNPIRQFLLHPQQYSPISSKYSMFDSRMSVDFGVNVTNFQHFKENKTMVADFISEISKCIDFVLILEHFDESLVIMKRMLGWTLKDILYFQANSFDSSVQTMNWTKRTNFSDDIRDLHRTWASIDYALYDHFLEEFIKKRNVQPCNFTGEVDALKKIRETVNIFCSSLSETLVLSINATQWSEEFQIMREDCQSLYLDEPTLTQMARNAQKKRTIRTNRKKYFKFMYNRHQAIKRMNRTHTI